MPFSSGLVGVVRGKAIKEDLCCYPEPRLGLLQCRDSIEEGFDCSYHTSEPAHSEQSTTFYAKNKEHCDGHDFATNMSM